MNRFDPTLQKPSQEPFVREEGIDKPQGTKQPSIPNTPRSKDNSSIPDISEKFNEE
jgi:hypothetical protein